MRCGWCHLVASYGLRMWEEPIIRDLILLTPHICLAESRSGQVTSRDGRKSCPDLRGDFLRGYIWIIIFYNKLQLVECLYLKVLDMRLCLSNCCK